MGLGNVFKKVGHGLEVAGEDVAKGAAAGAVIVASQPQGEVVEVERPLPGPYDVERREEVVIERPVVEHRPGPVSEQRGPNPVRR